MNLLVARFFPLQDALYLSVLFRAVTVWWILFKRERRVEALTSIISRWFVEKSRLVRCSLELPDVPIVHSLEGILAQPILRREDQRQTEREGEHGEDKDELKLSPDPRSCFPPSRLG